MVVFSPTAIRIGDEDIPVFCPKCESTYKLRDLCFEDKEKLIDLKYHHDLNIDLNYLNSLALIVERFPGTRHPVIKNKLPRNRTGTANEQEVDKAIDRIDGLRAFLAKSNFNLEARLRFLRQHELIKRPHPLSEKLICPMCPNQYLLLEEAYFLKLGHGGLASQ